MQQNSLEKLINDMKKFVLLLLIELIGLNNCFSQDFRFKYINRVCYLKKTVDTKLIAENDSLICKEAMIRSVRDTSFVTSNNWIYSKKDLLFADYDYRYIEHKQDSIRDVILKQKLDSINFTVYLGSYCILKEDLSKPKYDVKNHKIIDIDFKTLSIMLDDSSWVKKEKAYVYSDTSDKRYINLLLSLNKAFLEVDKENREKEKKELSKKYPYGFITDYSVYTDFSGGVHPKFLYHNTTNKIIKKIIINYYVYDTLGRKGIVIWGEKEDDMFTTSINCNIYPDNEVFFDLSDKDAEQFTDNTKCSVMEIINLDIIFSNGVKRRAKVINKNKEK